MTAARCTAAILAALATGLVWIDLLASKSSATDLPFIKAVLGGAMLMSPMILALSRYPTGLMRFAVFVLVTLPTAMLCFALVGGEPALKHWPLTVAALASALAILMLTELDGRDPMPAACFPLGAFLFSVMLTVIGDPISPVGWPEGLELTTRTPVHLALTVLAGVVTAALIIAATRRSISTRATSLLRALIGLLPLLGFTGTILGIIQTLTALPNVFVGGGADPAALAPVLAGLSTAFETTLIGLVAAVCAGFALAVLQSALSGDQA